MCGNPLFIQFHICHLYEHSNKSSLSVMLLLVTQWNKVITTSLLQPQNTVIPPLRGSARTLLGTGLQLLSF